MEKATPHCKLSVVKALVASGKVRATKTALVGGAALGLDALGIIQVVSALRPSNFYKSMTTHGDHACLARRVSAQNPVRRGLSQTLGR